MKMTYGRLRYIIQEVLAEEYGEVLTGKEKGMSVSQHPPSGMTGLAPGDVVYLTRDMYLDADIFPFGDDFPPVTVVELGDMDQLVGTPVPGDPAPPSEWDWVAGATGPAFVGSYESAPGIAEEELVFPVDSIDWEYTRRGPKEPWAMPEGPGMYAGGGNFSSP